MKTHRRQSLDDRTPEGGKQSAKTHKPRPANVEKSIRDLQATVGNRAVGDLMTGSAPTLQGSFFSAAFGGLEDWLGKESSEGRSGLDASSKAEVEDTSLKETPSDNSMKAADAADKWDASQKADAADKWDASQKADAADKWDASQKGGAADKWDGSQKGDAADKWDGSEKGGAADKWDGSEKGGAADKWDASEKSGAADKWDASEKGGAADKWDASEKGGAADKWDASQKADAPDKWDASEKSERGLASKADELGSELELEEF